MRLTNEELQKVKDKYGVDTLYSWSRLETFRTSKFEYFLSYVLHKKPDREDSIYGVLGGQVHDIIERFYNNEISYDDMLKSFEDSWLTCYDLAKLCFVRSDTEKDKSIAEKYKTNLQHFFKNHKKIPYNIALEKFLVTKVDSYALQGYCDALYKNKEGIYTIVDWKTSSYFNSKAAEEKCGQLVVYAQSLIQAGIKLEDIRICWNMLKYCNVEVTMKNSNTKVRTIERCKLGESLVSNTRMWLKNYGCDEDEIDNYLKQMIDSNSIEHLPIEIQNKFSIDDCYVFVPLTQKLIDKWNNEIIATIKDIELRRSDYETSHNEKIWWDTEESIKAQSYYMANLMSYSPNLHKPYAEYLDKLEVQKNGNDLFANIGSSVTSTSKDICNDKKNDNDMDLSWLDSI